MKRARRFFSPEFKAEAVRLIQERGYSVSQACRDIETERHICWAIFGQKIDETAGIIQQTAAKMAKSK